MTRAADGFAGAGAFPYRRVEGLALHGRFKQTRGAADDLLARIARHLFKRGIGELDGCVRGRHEDQFIALLYHLGIYLRAQFLTFGARPPSAPQDRQGDETEQEDGADRAHDLQARLRTRCEQIMADDGCQDPVRLLADDGARGVVGEEPRGDVIAQMNTVERETDRSGLRACRLPACRACSRSHRPAPGSGRCRVRSPSATRGPRRRANTPAN